MLGDRSTPLCLLESLQKSQGFDEAFSLYQEVVMALGYGGVLYGFAPTLYATDTMFNAPVFKACGLYTEEFLAYYHAKQLDRDDFTVKAILNGDLMEKDWWFEQKRGVLTRREERALEVTRHFGLKNGISIPLMKNSNGFAGISVASDKERPAFEALNLRNLPTLRAYTFIFNNYVWTYQRSELGRLSAAPILGTLSDTEKKLLSHLPSGKSLKVIYNDIGLSQSYGDNVLGKLRQKFGNVTTGRLIYYAGLLQINEYVV